VSYIKYASYENSGDLYDCMSCTAVLLYVVVNKSTVPSFTDNMKKDQLGHVHDLFLPVWGMINGKRAHCEVLALYIVYA